MYLSFCIWLIFLCWRPSTGSIFVEDGCEHIYMLQDPPGKEDKYKGGSTNTVNKQPCEEKEGQNRKH